MLGSLNTLIQDLVSSGQHSNGYPFFARLLICITILLIPLATAALGFYLVATPDTFESEFPGVRAGIIATSSFLILGFSTKIVSDVMLSAALKKTTSRESDEKPGAISSQLHNCKSKVIFFLTVNILSTLLAAACGLYWLSQRLQLPTHDTNSFVTVSQQNSNLEIAFSVLWILSVMSQSSYRSAEVALVSLASKLDKVQTPGTLGLEGTTSGSPKVSTQQSEKLNHFMRYWSHQRQLSGEVTEVLRRPTPKTNNEGRSSLSFLSFFSKKKTTPRNSGGYLSRKHSFSRYQYPAPMYRDASDLLESTLDKQHKQNTSISNYTTEPPNNTNEMEMGQYRNQFGNSNHTEDDTQVDDGAGLGKQPGGVWGGVRSIFKIAMPKPAVQDADSNSTGSSNGSRRSSGETQPNIIDVGTNLRSSFGMDVHSGNTQSYHNSHRHHSMSGEFMDYKSQISKAKGPHGEFVKPVANSGVQLPSKKAAGLKDVGRGLLGDTVNQDDFASLQNSGQILKSASSAAFDDWDLNSESVRNRYISTISSNGWVSSNGKPFHMSDSHIDRSLNRNSVAYSNQFNSPGFVSGTETPVMSSSASFQSTVRNYHSTMLPEQLHQFYRRPSISAIAPIPPPKSPIRYQRREEAAARGRQQWQQDYVDHLAVPSTPPLVVHKRANWSLPVNELSKSNAEMPTQTPQLHKRGHTVDDRYDQLLNYRSSTGEDTARSRGNSSARSSIISSLGSESPSILSDFHNPIISNDVLSAGRQSSADNSNYYKLSVPVPVPATSAGLLGSVNKELPTSSDAGRNTSTPRLASRYSMEDFRAPRVTMDHRHSMQDLKGLNK